MFQFSDLKEKCLSECRHPTAYLMRHYRRGRGAAFRTGAGHGVFCVGRCWALMLLTFAVRVANLVWMAALTAIMIFEKNLPGGAQGVRAVGAGLVCVAILVLMQSDWLPPGLGYATDATVATHGH